MSKNLLNLVIDYSVFVTIVILATVVPLWNRIFKKNEALTKTSYVFATGTSFVSMMLSIARGTLGVKTLLGFPPEQFYRGIGMWETLYGMVTAYPIVAFVFIPVYFNLGITSVYQYIELRFKSRFVRCLASGTYIFRSILVLGVNIYTPAVAFEAIQGIPLWITICSMAGISMIFNLIGGLKATVKADMIQVIISALVSSAIIIHSTFIAGGVKEVYKVNRESGRLNFFNFSGDMTVRVDTTSAWLGQLLMQISIFGCQQSFVQRFLSMKNSKAVCKTLMSNIPVITVFFSLPWLVGMCIYAVYSDCDPLKAGYTKTADAILPFYVEDKYSFIPGLMGVFLSTLFNSALILNVSNLNSLATCTWEDFLSNLPQLKGMSDKKQLQIIKLIGTIYGFMTIGCGFMIATLSGITEAIQLVTSATSGPLLGVFILAILVPFANWKGAACGMIISHVSIFFLTLGGLLVKKSSEYLETSILGCTNETFSSHIAKPQNFISMTEEASNYFTPVSHVSFLENVFLTSYMYYVVYGTLITVVLGILISLITRSSDDSYDSKLIHPWVYKLTNCLPCTERLFTKTKPPVDDLPCEHYVGILNSSFDPNEKFV